MKPALTLTQRNDLIQTLQGITFGSYEQYTSRGNIIKLLTITKDEVLAIGGKEDEAGELLWPIFADVKGKEFDLTEFKNYFKSVVPLLNQRGQLPFSWIEIFEKEKILKPKE